uniref:HRDC domain-containing protein n=1 Tax=Nonomuraea lactucae TaxID=2249762 RepID=UPI001966B8A5
LTGRAPAQARASSAGRSGTQPGARERRIAAPVSCRVCARTLVAAAEQKLGRCGTCPADYDEALLESLKAWRTATAKESKVPPYVVFTDVTLQAIAERVPTSEQELLSIAGIGRVKLDRYGEAVLSLCRSAAR